MKFVKTTLAAALLGMSVNAFAAVNDLSNITHNAQSGQELKVGPVSESRWTDQSTLTTRTDYKPFSKTAGNYRFSDINSVTHK